MLYQNLFFIVPDEKTGCYEVVEHNCIYKIDKFLFSDLKAYFKKLQVGIMSEWYELLNDEDKKKVQIIPMPVT